MKLTLFEDQRLTQSEAFAQTIELLRFYRQSHKHWAAAYSGGKDSTATVAVVIQAIQQGLIEPPESLTVIYADTRQELPPLHDNAMKLLELARKIGFNTRVCCAELDNRFWVYILGRGVPSPNNGTFRWCTERIKINPMRFNLQDLLSGLPEGQRLLMLTGRRIGESAARDRTIALSCGKDGGECGQGAFRQATNAEIDTIDPIIHWRECHVWDYLIESEIEHGLPTMAVAEIYGLSLSQTGESQDEDISHRTGCIGCPLVSGQDSALARLVKQEQWRYLSPLLEIRGIHDEIRLRKNRIRKDGSERRKDGTLVKNPGRVGPLKLSARLHFLERILDIQKSVNETAISECKPPIYLINAEEELRIRELIELKTFPDKWTGNEISGDAVIPETYSDGSVQPLLFDFRELMGG